MHNFYGQAIPAEQMQDLFCAHCGVARDGIADIVAHLKAAHGEKNPTSGEDFLSAASIIRWQRETAADIEKFGLNLDSLRGPDDFILECGGA